MKRVRNFTLYAVICYDLAWMLWNEKLRKQQLRGVGPKTNSKSDKQGIFQSLKLLRVYVEGENCRDGIWKPLKSIL